MKNKSVVITGASRGIGRACALMFARQGYDVLIGYNKNEAAAGQTLAAVLECGVKGAMFSADISSAAGSRRLISKAMYEFGGIDVLVNNAGIARVSLMTDVSEEDFSELFSTNVGGVYFTSQAVIPEMINAGGGKIINISSMWGQVGASCETLYSATKAAIIGLTKAMAKELAPSHINVNCVAPGVIDTDMNSCYDENTMDDLKAKTPLSRLGTPEDIAHAVCFLASDDADFITGEVLSVNGGFVI
ncbi:MAG: elongation factor P 5-aminopentanone reductase [Eubacteriales bacterium]